MGIVYRVIATYLLKKAGFNKRQAETGAVTLIQRFGSSLNLNIHFHMLFFDGVYVKEEENLRFVSIAPPRVEEIVNLTHKISMRIGRFLEHAGYIE